ncbi:RNA polymerase sigma-70 factor, ECF subfamily [Microlunatus flavus]|uniref:RNA polymerase sigma-70 factor, ECF subfamily n=1 Tax=Microlunatus flavus TaxID=1036181 RepID=A0A1H9B699_9ACTN|nr:RNA polymerase sigma-70 factor, ECF subfamily [Microlunatus flavus]
MTEGQAPHPTPGAAATATDDPAPGSPGPGGPGTDDREPGGRGSRGADPSSPEPGSPGPSDAELLRAHVEGDPQAFSTLVRRHQDRLWAVALRVMGGPDDAADALQDAYVAAFRRAGTFRGDAQVTTWLHRVVVNACLDRLRRAKVRAADPLPEDLDRAELLGREPERDPLEEQERQDAVADALQTLNPDQRAALVLVDMQGYSVDEAARILGCAPGTVKSRCARGRARLVPLLTHLRDPPDERQGAPP